MRNKNISKKVAVSLMIGSLAIGPAAGAILLPLHVVAKEEAATNDNPKGGYLEFAPEYLVNNYGDIDTDDSAVENNFGTIRAVNQNAGVLFNEGIVKENSGAVLYNNGEVTDNFRFGFVGNIDGTVVNNYEEAAVFGGDREGASSEIGNGTIDNNIGGIVGPGYNAKDLLTINNYYYGKILKSCYLWNRPDDSMIGKIHIINDFSEENNEELDFVTVDKKYHYVDVAGAENVDITYDGFIFGNYDKKQYALVAADSEPVDITATITLRAKDGYELSDDGQLSGKTDKLSYELDKNDDGSYTLKITSLSGNANITIDSLHLHVGRK